MANHWPRCPTYRGRYVKGKGAILVLVWNMLVFSYFGAQESILQEIVGSTKPYAWVFSILLLRAFCLVIFYPVAGWLADVYFGRYQTIRGSFWLMWIGTVSLTLILVVSQGTGSWHDKNIIRIVLCTLAFIAINIGLAGFQANAIPFGTDQLHSASAEELSSFVHWFYWTEYFGLGLVTYFLTCVDILGSNVLVQALIVLVSLSLALLLDFFCSHWLLTQSETQNPLKTVVGVLRYAAKHKYPRQRSAFTYCEDEIPSRINLGKAKYGGPFMTEQVEDVKTFLQILLVLCVLGGGIVVRIAADNAVDRLAGHLQHPSLNFEAIGSCYSHLFTSSVVLWMIIIGIPVYEFVIYPLFHNYIPSMLKRVGIGIAVAVVSIFVQLMIDVVGHAKTDLQSNQTLCIFSSGNATLNIDYQWTVLPYILNGFVRMLIYISSFEFICAQSPHQMKGLLIGLFYCLRGIFIIAACIILLGFYFASPTLHPSCGFWYYLTNLAIGTGGMLLYCIGTKGYKNRQRDDVGFEQRFAEAYYSRYLQ